MPNFDFPEMTDWTLYLASPYTPGDKYLICEFLPDSTVQIPTNIGVGVLDLWGSIFGQNLHTEPYDYCISEGLLTVLPATTEIPYLSGGTPATLSDKYVIDHFFPGGFIPMFVSAGLYPNSFRHERFAVVYMIEGETSDYYPPLGHEHEEKTINGDPYLLYRPPSSHWFDISPGWQLICEDGDLYYQTFLPHYPYEGVVWVRRGFTFGFFHQDSSFWGDVDPSFETFSFPWGQPDTPTEYLFEADLNPHFNLHLDDMCYWINGDTVSERHAERVLLQDTLLDPFPSEFRDGHLGCLDRFHWYEEKCDWPDNTFNMDIHMKIVDPNKGNPDWWRGLYYSRWYGEDTEPGTGLFLRRRGEGATRTLPVPLLMSLTLVRILKEFYRLDRQI